MELPLFDGEDALGWIVRIERYFSINGVEGDERMELVLVALEGRALNWFQTWEEHVCFPTWRQFREAVLRRFQPGVVKDPHGPLLKLKQTRSVLEYIEQFEKVSGPLRDVDRGIMRSIFVNGLRGELQAEIKSLELNSLAEIKNRALMLEERNREWRGSGLAPVEKGGGSFRGPPLIRGGLGGRPNNNSKEVMGPKPGEGKRLSQVELQERSRKGLCFKCGERWGLDHVCKMKNYRLVLVEGSDEEPLENEEPEKEKELEELELRTLQVSLNSLKGLTSSKSFKVIGSLEGKEVIILIDTGATNNFLSKNLAKQLKLPIEETPMFTVEVGNGQKEPSTGVCREVVIEVQGIRINQPFFFYGIRRG